MKEAQLRVFRMILLIAALGMCVYGGISGEAEDVLMKASRICMECIGLG